MRYTIVSIIVVALLVLVRAPAFADSLAILIDAHGSLTNGGLTYSNFSASLNFNNPDGTFSVRPSLQSIQITSDSNLFANTLQIRQVQWSGTIDLSIFNASKPELLLAVAYDVSGPVNHVAASQIEPALLGTTITRGDHFVTATLPSGNLLLSLNNSTHLQSIPGSGSFPRPTIKGLPVREDYNQWLVVDEVSEGSFLFQNRHSNHEVQIGFDSIREYRSPAIMILRGSLTLMDNGKCEFEPSAPGLAEPTMEDMVDRKKWSESRSTYEALKGFVSQPITVRGRTEGGGTEEVVLEKCTPHNVVICRPQIIISKPEWMTDITPGYPMTFPPIPEKRISVSLENIQITEDVDHNRPVITFESSSVGGQSIRSPVSCSSSPPSVPQK